MVYVTPRLTGKLVSGGITISGVTVETNVGHTKEDATLTVVEVLAPPTVVLIGCSSTFGVLFRKEGIP